MANADLRGFGETVVFLNLFSDLPPRQADKGRYLLWETRLLCPLTVLTGAETFVDIAGSARRSSILFCGGSDHATALPRMVTSATSLRRLTLRNSGAASLLRSRQCLQIDLYHGYALPPSLQPNHRREHCSGADSGENSVDESGFPNAKR
jgi:hypothetical protein